MPIPSKPTAAVQAMQWTLSSVKSVLQNMLSWVVECLSYKAGLTQTVRRRIALAGGTGPVTAPGVFPCYPIQNPPVLPTDYEDFDSPLTTLSGKQARISAIGATRLPANLTGTEVTLSIGWAPAIASVGDIYRVVGVERYRVGALPASVGVTLSGALAMPVSGGAQPESIVLNVGSDVLADDYIKVVAYREASNAGDTFPAAVDIVALDLIYDETVSLVN